MEDKKETLNYQLYMLDKTFKDRYNLIKVVNQAQDFYNGKQYPNVNYTNMLRTTINICSFSANIKASKICGTPIYLTFTSDNGEDCTPVRQFDEYNQKRLHLETFGFQSALNGWVNGTEVAYMRWDNDDTTYKGIYKGGLKIEHIDIRRFAVANPKLNVEDFQNQKWVMFWKDESVGALKDLVEGRSKAEINRKRKMLEREFASEDEIEKNAEEVNHGLITLYTRFFRKNGEVYFTCETKNVSLFKEPHPLSTRVSENVAKELMKKFYENQDSDEPSYDDEIIKDLDIDYEDAMIQGADIRLDDESYADIKEKFNLYPFAIFEPYRQNNDFYGRSDITQMIPIQKFINYGVSLIMKCIENNANGKYIVKPDTLGEDQEITTEPSQVITDYSGFTNGWGIKMLESQPVPNAIFDFIQQLFGLVRIVYGFNDVMDGSVTNQDLSGFAIQQMIKQSNTAIEQQQKLFWEFNTDLAQIRLMFYKHYVDKAKYTFELDESQLDINEQSRKMMYNKLLRGGKLETLPNATPQDFEKPTSRIQVREITQDKLYGVNFDISVDAMQGLADSKLVEQQMWDNLILNGSIANLDPELLAMYLEASPNISTRTKDALKNVVEKQRTSELTQLREQLRDVSQKALELGKMAQGLGANNKYLNEYIKNLEKSFKGRIDESNNIINGLVKDIDRQKEESQKKSQNATSVSSDQVA